MFNVFATFIDSQSFNKSFEHFWLIFTTSVEQSSPFFSKRYYAFFSQFCVLGRAAERGGGGGEGNLSRASYLIRAP